MIEIIDKVDCCGCNACGDICAQKAITFKNDEEGLGIQKSIMSYVPIVIFVKKFVQF